MPSHPFKPIKECQNVARSLLGFFRKEKGVKTHLESAQMLLNRFEDDTLNGRLITARSEAKLRYHMLSWMYTEDRATIPSTCRTLRHMFSWAKTYLAQAKNRLDFLIFVMPYLVFADAGPSSRASSGVWFWKQKENTHAFLSLVREFDDTVQQVGLTQLLEAGLDSFRKWHAGFCVDIPAAPLAFSLMSNTEDDRERILGSFCYATTTESAEPDAVQYWITAGRATLAAAIRDTGLTPERVALSLMGMKLVAAWDRAATPDGGYRAMIKSTRPNAMINDPFSGLTFTSVPLPFESQVAFEKCLGDANMRSLIFAMSIRRERPSSKKVQEVLRTGIADPGLFEDALPDTSQVPLKDHVVSHVTMQSQAIFDQLREALTGAPVNLNYVMKTLENKYGSDPLDKFEYLRYDTYFNFIAGGLGRYLRANLAAWGVTFTNMGEHLDVVTLLFKAHVDRDLENLDADVHVQHMLKHFEPIALKFDYSDADLQAIKDRCLAREQADPGEVYARLLGYANVCIITGVLGRALSKETKEVLNVRARDLVFGNMQEETNDDEAVV